MILVSYEDLRARCERIADECRRQAGPASLTGCARRVAPTLGLRRPHIQSVEWDYEGESQFSIGVTFSAVVVVRKLQERPTESIRWPLGVGADERAERRAVREFCRWRDALVDYEKRMLQKHWLLSKHPVRQRWWTERVFAGMQLVTDPRLALFRDDG